ncbi:hypothetical protein JW935_01100 [candidate division KSB1 bacterium]|nr:hypothetical protein [candidate division KSB1 bacterium]
MGLCSHLSLYIYLYTGRIAFLPLFFQFRAGVAQVVALHFSIRQNAMFLFQQHNLRIYKHFFK